MAVLDLQNGCRFSNTAHSHQFYLLAVTVIDFTLHMLPRFKEARPVRTYRKDTSKKGLNLFS
jgi:hypothetical protein